MSVNILCTLVLILIETTVGIPRRNYSKDCTVLCRDGCPSDLTGTHIELCQYSRNICNCYSSTNTDQSSSNSGDGSSRTQKTDAGDTAFTRDHVGDLYSSSKSRGSPPVVLYSILIIVFVIITLVAILFLARWCYKDNSTFTKARQQLPNLQLYLAMAFQQPHPLGTNRKSKYLPQGNGYLDQMHLMPIAPAQDRGPIPGFLNPNFPPTYAPLC